MDQKKFKYKNKLWDVKDLIDHLIKENKELKKTQCKPCVNCIFRVEDQMYDKATELFYLGDED